MGGHWTSEGWARGAKGLFWGVKGSADGCSGDMSWAGLGGIVVLPVQGHRWVVGWEY